MRSKSRTTPFDTVYDQAIHILNNPASFNVLLKDFNVRVDSGVARSVIVTASHVKLHVVNRNGESVVDYKMRIDKLGIEVVKANVSVDDSRVLLNDLYTALGRVNGAVHFLISTSAAAAKDLITEALSNPTDFNSAALYTENQCKLVVLEERSKIFAVLEKEFEYEVNAAVRRQVDIENSKLVEALDALIPAAETMAEMRNRIKARAET